MYDIGVKRVNKVHKLLKQYLHWKQNSVFDGELSKGQFKTLENGLKSIIDKTKDMVLIYQIKMKKEVSSTILGIEKNKAEFVL